MDKPAWVITDRSGRINALSSEARELLGCAETSVGDDISTLFPYYAKAIRMDIELALTGKATGRTVLVRRVDGGRIAVKYKVSGETGAEGAQLLWELELDRAPGDDPAAT